MSGVDDTADVPATHAVVGIVTVSDRASRGDYEDRGGPGIRDYLSRVLVSPWTAEAEVVPDEQDQIESAIRSLAAAGCCLILTTGGTGPAPRDVTTEATLAACSKEMLSGLCATARSSGMTRYSANAPLLPPKTASPG